MRTRTKRTSITVEHLGWSGTGATNKEATDHAKERIKAAALGGYKPTILTCRNWAIIIWRDQDGWVASILMDNGTVRKDLCWSSATKDYGDCYAKALEHLAQCAWDGKEMLPPILEEIALRHPVPGSDGDQVLRDFRSWRGFQLAYRHAKANDIGSNDTTWHRWGCEHASEFADKVVEE